METLIGWDEDGVFLLVEENGETVSALPAFEDMTWEELTQYWERINDKIHAMDEKEPKQKSGALREAWEELHEELEDIRDEVAERIDDLSETR